MSLYTKTVTDTLTITSTVTPVYVRNRIVTTIHYLTFFDYVATSLIPNPKHLTVTSAVAVAPAVTPSHLRNPGQGITVTPTITVGFGRSRAVTDTLAISDYVVARKVLANNPYNWVNTPTANYAAGLIEPGTGASFKLVYSTTTLWLRKPDFGDADRYEAFRINRFSRGGDLQIFQDPMWPTTEILEFKFSQLDPAMITNLLSFLTQSLGAQIDLYDHYGRHWKGYILTPQGQVVNDKRATSTAAFTFQGTLQ